MKMMIAGLDAEVRPLAAPIHIPVGMPNEILGAAPDWWMPGIVAKIGGRAFTMSDARMMAALCAGACEQAGFAASLPGTRE